MAPSIVKEEPIALMSKKDRRQQEKKSLNKVQIHNRTVTVQKLNIRQYPKFNGLEEERLYRKQHLAAGVSGFCQSRFRWESGRSRISEKSNFWRIIFVRFQWFLHIRFAGPIFHICRYLESVILGKEHGDRA